MRRRTAIFLVLAVASLGAGAYVGIRTSGSAERAKVSAPARKTAQLPDAAPHRSTAARPARRHATRKRAHARHRAHKRRTRSAAHRPHRASRKRVHSAPSPADRADRDPGLGGLTGGEPAPIASHPQPVASPQVAVATPSVPEPAVPVSLPPGTTIGTVLDIIGAVTGAGPSPSAPAGDPAPQDCPASSSGPGSASSGHASGKSGSEDTAAAHTGASDIVSAIVDALCASNQATPDHKGETGAGGDGSAQRSGPGNGK